MSTRRSIVVALVFAVGVTACGTGPRPSIVADHPLDPTTTSTTVAATDTTTPTTTAPVEPIEAPNGRSYPPVPDDPGRLARELVSVERALRDESIDPERLPDLGHRQQVLYRALGRTPEWDETVLAAVPESLAADVSAHLTARRAFIDLVADSEPPENMPAWEIVEPEPLESLVSHYREAEEATGIEWEYLAAINLVETGMGRIVGLSTAGAQGPMQFIPTTWEEVGEGSIDDPHDSIQAAARYLVRRGGPEDMDAALWGYNNADEYVTAVQAYADLFRRNERNLVGPYHWEIHYFASVGDLWLPTGYRLDEPVPASQYVRDAPWSIAPEPVR